MQGDKFNVPGFRRKKRYGRYLYDDGRYVGRLHGIPKHMTRIRIKPWTEGWDRG